MGCEVVQKTCSTTKNATYTHTPTTTAVVTYHTGNLVRHAPQRRLVQLACRSQLGQIIKFVLSGAENLLLHATRWQFNIGPKRPMVRNFHLAIDTITGGVQSSQPHPVKSELNWDHQNPLFERRLGTERSF